MIAVLEIGQEVSFRVGIYDGRGVVEELLGNVAKIRQPDETPAFPLVSECTPIAEAPEFVAAAVAEEK